MGPLEMVKPWSTKGVEGVYRFLGRVWRLFIDDKSETDFEQAQTTAPAETPELLDQLHLSSLIIDISPTPEQLKALHTCIKKVTEDLEALRFNTAISALMIFVNEAMTWQTRPRVALMDFLLLLNPFAPHLAEELFFRMLRVFDPGKINPRMTMAYLPWPKHDPAVLVEETVELPVQVNGKLRDKVVVQKTATPAEIEALALSLEKVKEFTAGKTIKKVIVVPGKVVNVAVA